MVRNLYRNRTLRSFVLPVLRLVNRDIKIRHHWTGHKIRLNLFRHKGYWFHGRRRELREMQAFEKLIDPLDVVAEVGGHIGYLSLWFAELTREGGWVFVFEPGDNNLPYLRDNLVFIRKFE